MASQKDKLLDSAQKATLKGQFDRAIKDYEQVIALEPKEMRHRQKLAELYARVNRAKDAIKEYEIIAKSYEAAGFYLKSIAVYKQIQKIDPKNISVSLTLASLNEKQGLVGNALAEYKIVVDHYESTGASAQAAGILERMLALDQDNLNVQLKLAETYFAAGMIDQAYNEFTKAVSALKSRGDHAAFDRVCKKMEGLFPGRDFILDVAAAEIAAGDFSGAAARLLQVLKKNESNIKALNLLEEVYRKTGETAKRKQILEKIVRYFPLEVAAKKGLIECTIAEKDAPGANQLLKQYSSEILAKHPTELEGYYKSLLEISPYDNALLEGLKKVYEATGDQLKLADISSRLAVAEPPKVAKPAAQAAPPPPPEPPMADAEVDVDVDLSGFDNEELEDISISVSTPPPPPSPRIEVEWEDVDVSLDDDPLGTTEDVVDGGMGDIIEDVDVIEEPSIADVVEEGEDLLEDEVDEIDMEYVEEDEDVVNIDDLAASDTGHLFELSEEFAVLADSASQESNRKLSKYSSSGVLSAFKKSVDQVLDKKDSETHYNLGIAYKEMGLFDDAIAEFKTVASIDPARKLDCLTLKSICHRDKGEYDRAEEIITSLLANQTPGDETVLSLKYELAQIYEVSGRVDEALWLYQEIVGQDPDFRDVPKRLARLQGEEEVLSTLGSDMVDLDLEELE